MSWVNFYNCKNASGTVLTDSIGTNNGTLAGASLPTINANGYLSFNGDHGASGGNWSRVTLGLSDFQYNANSSFTYILIWRPTGTITNTGLMFFCGYNNQIGWTRLGIYSAYVRHHYSGSTSGSKDNYTRPTSEAVNKIITTIISYNNNTYQFIENYKNGTIAGTIVGNLYIAGSEANLGAMKMASNYAYDYEGDIFMFANKNDAMSIGQMKTYDAYLRGMV